MTDATSTTAASSRVGVFVSTDWRANMTILLIILFFMPPLFVVAYKLGVHVRDHYDLARIAERPLRKEANRADRKRGFQQWGTANCGENFERALQKDEWLVKELTESEQETQDALSQIRAARLRSCRDLGYSN